MIMASTKEEVKSILMENLSDEESILNIFSETEFQKMYNKDGSVNAIYADPNDYQNGNDFFENVINSAKAEGINQQNQNQNQLKSIKIENQVQNNEFDNQASIESKIFELNGEKILLKNNKLYKLNWIELDSEEIKKFRIINSKTKKEIKNENYIIQKLDWNEIKS